MPLSVGVLVTTVSCDPEVYAPPSELSAHIGKNPVYIGFGTIQVSALHGGAWNVAHVVKVGGPL